MTPHILITTAALLLIAPPAGTDAAPDIENLHDIALWAFYSEVAEEHYRAERREEWWLGHHSIIPAEYREVVADINRELGIPPEIIYRLVRWESGWRANAQGHNPNGTTDRGIMQLNNRYEAQFVARYFSGGEDFDVWNAEHSLEVGMKLLAGLHSYFGDWRSAVMAYNAGRGAVRLGRIPESTKRYVRRIL